MSLYSLADFRRLHDEHGLVLYADSVAAHRATLERLQDPEALRVGFVAEWERLEQMDLDELTREIAQKQLKKRAREALSAARAAIAHEQAEIERVTALYHQARYQQEEDSMNISDTMIYYLYGETGITEVRPLERFGQWQRSLCTEMDIHHQPVHAYVLVEYVEPPVQVRLAGMRETGLWR